jgi:hypothetical protein
MNELLQDITYRDYLNLHKYVLAAYILFGTFILKLLLGQKKRFIRNDRNILITYIIFLILFAGTRAKNIGVDTGNYYAYFFLPASRLDGFFAIFYRLNTDFLFEIIIALTVWTDNYNATLIVIAVILNITLYFFVRKFTNFGKEGSSLLLFLTLASSFSFMNLEVNIMRNALALGFILLSLPYVLEGKYKKSILLLVTAFLFHRTSIILIFVILAVLAARKVPVKYFIILYFLAILVSIAGFGFHSISFLESIGSDDLKSLSYSGDTNYNIGFRLDFVTYNTFFLVLFLHFLNKDSVKNIFLLKYYILTSIIFFFNFYIPFSDRFGLFSWLIIPLLLYNIVNESYPEKKVFISTVVVISFFIINDIILFP